MSSSNTPCYGSCQANTNANTNNRSRELYLANLAHGKFNPYANSSTSSVGNDRMNRIYDSNGRSLMQQFNPSAVLQRYQDVFVD